MNTLARTSFILLGFSAYVVVAFIVSLALGNTAMPGLVRYLISCVIMFPAIAGTSLLIERNYRS